MVWLGFGSSPKNAALQMVVTRHIVMVQDLCIVHPILLNSISNT
jgi:hypothetical protein